MRRPVFGNFLTCALRSGGKVRRLRYIFALTQTGAGFLLLAFSRRIRRRIFPLGFLAITSVNSTPPASHLYWTLASATCCSSILSDPLSRVSEDSSYLDDGSLGLLILLWAVFDAQSGTSTQDDPGHGKLPAVLVWHSDDADVCYIRMAKDVSFQFCRSDLEPSDFHYFLSNCSR